MKKMRILVFVLLLLLLYSVLTVTTFAAGSSLDDRAGLLSDAEYTEVNDAITRAERDTGVDFLFCIYDGYEESLTDSAYLVMHEGTLSFRGILLMIKRQGGTYYYDLYTYGDAYEKITDREVDVILDDPAVYDNLKGGSLAPGIVAFCQITADAYLSDIEPFDIRTVLIPLFIALFASIAVCIVIFVRYKRKSRAKSYPLDTFARLTLGRQEDIFLDRHITRIRINRGSSHGGGGGRGGGGHRGGR